MDSGVPLNLHAAPASGFEEPFAMLSACHERVERMLGLLARLDAHLAANGADPEAAEAARDVMRYFDRAAPAHHEDEERHVLPALRASGEPGLAALADRLHADHEAMSATWLALRPHLETLAAVAAPATYAAGLPGPWREFVALYGGHIEAEEGTAFPQASSMIEGAARLAMGSEMAQRRGLPSLAPPPTV